MVICYLILISDYSTLKNIRELWLEVSRESGRAHYWQVINLQIILTKLLLTLSIATIIVNKATPDEIEPKS